MSPYPSLPLCPVQQDGETLPEYASRVLRHVLATDTTATLSDEQLSLADMAAQRAASQLRADDGRASRLDAAQLQTAQTLTDTRHRIAQILAWRRADDAQRCAAGQPATQSFPLPGTQGGRPAPLNPPPPRGPGSPDALALPGGTPSARRF